MNAADKVVSWDKLPAWRDALRTAGRRLVATNGCFDLLHRGHVTYLQAARNEGDALLIGLNADASVRNLKGPGRPVHSEDDRAFVLAALECVDGVCIFREPTAMTFLEIVRPDIYAKGGDYNIDTINQDERRLVERMGGKVVVLAGVPGHSTTGLLEKISKL